MMQKTATLLVVMGVSGAGKSTFAKAISDTLALDYKDGDDLHAPESVAKMQAGLALQDADRWPWLDRVALYLAEGGHHNAVDQGRVVACSALKRVYRDRIRRCVPLVQFIFLDADAALLHHRLAARTGHFMQPELLNSQLRTLEKPGADEQDVITLDAALSIDQLVSQAISGLFAQRSSELLGSLHAY
jgi:gluconokinase